MAFPHRAEQCPHLWGWDQGVCALSTKGPQSHNLPQSSWCDQRDQPALEAEVKVTRCCVIGESPCRNCHLKPFLGVWLHSSSPEQFTGACSVPMLQMRCKSMAEQGVNPGVVVVYCWRTNCPKT